MDPLSSGLPEIVADNETLARFLTSSGQFNTTMAKPGAFLPDTNDRETSVFRVIGQSLENIWAISDGAASGRKIYGAAIFKAQTVRAVQLDVVADEPPPRHAVIRKRPWIETDPDLLRARHREFAIVLAQESKLCLK